ncbi:MAG: NTE family protein [Cocleimonas sp.]|jgi:NTE family protein
MVVFSGEKPIAEILHGESIGEIAFLNGGSRTATVIASLNCKLLQLDKKSYHTLINDAPEITQSIIKSLTDRLTANNISISELEPKASNIVALLHASDCVIHDIFIDQLFNLENEISHSWKIINASDLKNTEKLSEWIQNNEDSSSQLILVATDTMQNAEMALEMADHADKSFLIVDNTLEGPTPASSLEQNVSEGSLLKNIDLVILRKDSSVKITDTSKILNGRQTHLHHHVAHNHQPDFGGFNTLLQLELQD